MMATRDTVHSAAIARAAVGTVVSGEIISLSLDLDALGKSPSGRPAPVRHVRLSNQNRPLLDGRSALVNDDDLFFALQGSSHWDSLAHVGVVDKDGRARFHGEVDPNRVMDPDAGLTIDSLGGAIVGRGVLLDFVEHFDLDPTATLNDDYELTAEDIRSCLTREQVELGPGDIVLIRTGYESLIRANTPSMTSAGLGLDALELLLVAGVCAIASDNPAVEPVPAKLFVHIRALVDAGVLLGELWALDALAQACALDRRYTSLLVSAPLRIGAFGSPANAVAIR